MEWRIELIGIPVADVDRSIAFYRDRVGFVLDHDHEVSDEIRFIQLTPPGSACSIAFGKGVVDRPPGSAQGIQMVVGDIEEAHRTLSANGVDVTDIDVQPWGSFVHFQDPDGNGWSVQQLRER